MVKRLVFILFIFFSSGIYSQRLNPDISKERTLDSLIRSNRIRYGIMTRNRLLELNIKQVFKVSLRTTLNSSVMSKIDIRKFESEVTEDVSQAFEEIFTSLDEDDYMSILAYDIRCKVRIKRGLNVLGRCYVAGVQYGNNTYFFGFEYKF